MKITLKILFSSFLLIFWSFFHFPQISLAAPPPPSVIISATPDTIQAGSSAILTWTTKKADSCVLDPGNITVNCNETRAVFPTATTTYTFTATGSTGTTIANATITVNQQVNQVPSAADDTYSISMNTPVTIASVLINDELGDEPTTVSAFDTTSLNGGIINYLGNGIFEYTPAVGYFGSDSFTYTIMDSDAEISTATVIINVTRSIHNSKIGVIAAGGYCTVGVSAYGNGTVVATGPNPDQLNVSDWTDIVRVAAGYLHTVGLRSDGTVVATGLNNYGEHNVGSWTDIVQVAAGGNHTVGVKSDGTVVATGDNTYGQLNVDSWADIVQVATAGYHTVGVKSDGTVVATGLNNYGQLNVGSWTDIVQVAAGGYHTVGVKSDGTVVATGANTYGQLNVDSWTDIVQVAAGSNHTVGLKSDGTVVATGDNYVGQLNVSSWTDIVEVAAGSNHTVGLKSDGTVVGAYIDSYGELNVYTWELNTGVLHAEVNIYGTSFNTPLTTGNVLANDKLGARPTTITAYDTISSSGVEVHYNGDGTFDYSPAADFTGSDSFTYTITDSTAETSTATVIIKVFRYPKMGVIAAGFQCTVGISAYGDGKVASAGNYCPESIVNNWTDVVQVASEFNHTVGLKSDGTVIGTGFNFSGELNIGGWTDIVQVATGYKYTVGLKSDGTVVATGLNDYDQLKLNKWKNIVQVAAGVRHTIGLKSNGTVVATGDNTSGELNVGSWTDIVQVAAGNGHTVGLKSDGTVVATGYNEYGQLKVDNWTDIVQVTASSWHTVGLKSDGTVVAASRYFGSLHVGGWTDIVQVAVEIYHIVGLKSDGTVVGAGDNGHGEVNVSTWVLNTGLLHAADNVYATHINTPLTTLNVLANDKLGARPTTITAYDTRSAFGGDVHHNGDGTFNYSPAADFTGSDSFTYTITDSNGKTSTATITINVNTGAYYPKIGIVAAADNYSVGVSAYGDGKVLATGDNFYDQFNWDSLTDIVRVAGGNRHTVGIKSDGTVVGTGNNYYGQLNVASWTDIVQLAVSDSNGGNTGSRTFGLKTDGTVLGTGDNTYGQLNVANWTDIVQVAAAGYHTVGLKSDGTLIGNGSNDKGQLNVGSWTDIVQVAVGNEHTVGLKSDGTVVGTGSNNFGQLNLYNWIWTDIVQVAVGTNCTFGVKSDGTVIVTGKNNFYSQSTNVASWTDIVQVVAGNQHTIGVKSDGTVVATGDNNYGELNVSTWVLDTGILHAVNNEYTTHLNTSLTTDNVLVNDKLGARPTTITTYDTTSAFGGDVYYNGDGKFNYLPVNNFIGSDSFTYTITDNNVETSTATVLISVLPVPVAGDDNASTDEDAAVMIYVLSNDTDAYGNSLTITNFSSPANGIVIDNGDGSFTYTPHDNYNGSDIFTYTIDDGYGGSDSANVTITINPVNDLPGTFDQTVTAQASEAKDIILGASDVDNDPLSFIIVTSPANGSISGNDGDSQVTYTPAVGFTGQDTFSFKVNDGQVDSNTATVSVNVTWSEPTASMSADSVDILPYQDVNLTWSAANADTCILDPGAITVNCNGTMTINPLETTTYTFSATNPEYPDPVTASVTVNVTWPQPVIEFNSDKTDVAAGESVLLTWNTTYAHNVAIEPGLEALGESGSITVNPTTTTTYIMTASGPGGASTTSLTVNVHPAPTITFAAAPDTILEGEVSSLTWSRTDAYMVSIDQNIGDVTELNSYVVSPTETTTYIITATGFGGSASVSVTVNVTYPPPTVAVTATPLLIQTNEPVTLSWNSTEAETVTIGPNVGAVSLTGTHQVNPAETTLYTITAAGRGGTAVGWVRVFVDEQGAYSYGDPTPAEQAHLEAINRTRANPEAEAERLGIDLLEGLPEGTINGAVRQPLVMNSKLLQAAGLHAQDMVDNEFFAHYSPTDGRSPFQRISDAGYLYNAAAENIGAHCTTLLTSATDASLIMHDALFIDEGVEGRGHRLNMLFHEVKEIGIGLAVGIDSTIGDPTCYKVTSDFARSKEDSRSFVTGVVYEDVNGDGQYTAGEGMGDVVMDVSGAGIQTTTASAGGYGMPLDPGTYTLIASLPGGFSVSKDVTISDQNIKVDFLYSEFNVLPPTVSFTSDVYTIAPNDSATLSWESSYGYHIEIDNGINVVSESGSTTVSPNVTTTYTITVTGLEGVATQSVTITVADVPQPSVFFWASPELIPVGGTSTLSWNTFYADTCEILPDISTVPTEGSQPVSPAVTTTYTITCTGPGGTASDTVTISYPVPTAQITASPAAILSGQTVDLSWQTNDATSYTINGADTGTESGTMQVTPLVSTEYTLSATGPGGTATDTITVNVLDQQTLGVGITFPADGATLSLPYTMVQGIVTPGDAEVGLIVNGIPALRDGNNFYVNALPLLEGENTITVAATSTDGVTITESISVTVDTSQTTEWITLSFITQTGVAPFKTTLLAKLNTLERYIASSTLTYDGPGNIVITQVSLAEYDLNIADPGMYTLTYQATDNLNNAYQQDIMVYVYDKVELSTMLQGKWNAMRTSLATGDINGVLDIFSSNAKDMYSYNFNLLSDHLAEIAAGLQDITLIDMYDGEAEFEMLGVEEGVTYSFQVVFILDRDGIWRLRFF